jgi:hypothetical protein
MCSSFDVNGVVGEHPIPCSHRRVCEAALAHPAGTREKHGLAVMHDRARVDGTAIQRRDQEQREVVQQTFAKIVRSNRARPHVRLRLAERRVRVGVAVPQSQHEAMRLGKLDGRLAVYDVRRTSVDDHSNAGHARV